MKSGLARLIGLVVSAYTVAACSAPDAVGPTATGVGPIGTVSDEIVNPAVLATALRRTKTLSRDYTASITLSSSGGSLKIPEAGLNVNIPRGAITKTTTITVTALKGDLVAYEFQPHGIRFAVPLKLTQDLTYTTWAGNTGNTALEAGYFANTSQIDWASGSVWINEFLPVTVQATGNRLHWEVYHFSGYMISSGRKQ